jgi:hypothetical protein
MANVAPAPAQRGVVFGQLLRGGPSRAGPIFDRLDAAGVAQLVKALSPHELGMCAALAFAPARVERAATLPIETLVALVRAAERGDVDRLYAALPAERVADLRSALLPREERAHEPASPAKRGFAVVRRLRRFFSR